MNASTYKICSIFAWQWICTGTHRKKNTEIPCRTEHSCWASVMWNNQITRFAVSFPVWLRQVAICVGQFQNELWLAISILQGIMHINWTQFNQLGIWRQQMISWSSTLECLFLSAVPVMDCFHTRRGDRGGQPPVQGNRNSDFALNKKSILGSRTWLTLQSFHSRD